MMAPDGQKEQRSVQDFASLLVALRLTKGPEADERE